MKVLYAGHFEENSGWASAARNMVESMISVGIDVKILSIKLTPYSINESFSTEIIKASVIPQNYEATHLIQHVLPHHLCFSTRFKKNIAYYVEEGVSHKRNIWHDALNKMDEVWVPNNDLKNNLSKILNTKIKTVPHTFDTSVYEKEYENSIGVPGNLFNFYSISDMNDRKNIHTLLYSYMREFSIRDSVQLILKIGHSGMNQESLASEIKEVIDNVVYIGRFKSEAENPRIRIICNNLSRHQILSLHQYSNCFVSASHGEAWGIPAYEAMCFGKTPICCDEGGPKDFIDQNDISTGALVGGSFGPCKYSNPPFQHIFTGNSDWFNVDEKSLGEKMRWYYENQNSINPDSGLARGRKFDYQVIGEKIKELLNAN